MTTLPAVAEPAAIGFSMYDADSGETIIVTPEMQHAATETHSAIAASQSSLLYCIYRMGSERLYLALGCRSFRGYCEKYLERLGISGRTARRYRRIGEIVPKTLARLAEGWPPEAGMATVASLATGGQISVKKLDYLAMLPEEKITSLEDLDEIELEDGRVLTGRQLMALASAELHTAVKQLRTEKEALHEQNERLRVDVEAKDSRLNELADADERNRHYLDLIEQIQKYQLATVAAERARESWEKSEQIFDHQLAFLDKIPNVSDMATMDYARGVLESIIRRAQRILAERFA